MSSLAECLATLLPGTALEYRRVFAAYLGPSPAPWQGRPAPYMKNVCPSLQARKPDVGDLAADDFTLDDPEDLEEMLDALDDLEMQRDRAGVGRDKVKVWGAWLDSNVAGRKAAAGSKIKELQERLETEGSVQLTPEERADLYYDQSVVAMSRGKYTLAVELMREAVQLVGKETRKGGEFSLWLAEALQADDQDKEACTLLMDVLANNEDLEVQKVAKALLNVIGAPKPKLDDNETMNPALILKAFTKARMVSIEDDKEADAEYEKLLAQVQAQDEQSGAP